MPDPEKFQNKYRIGSARWQHWDYRWDAAYFITICTHKREHFLGAIHCGKMRLSHAGIVADILWNAIKIHAENIKLGEYVIMPNHIHGVLILSDNAIPAAPIRNDVVETGHALSLHALSLQSQYKTPGQTRFRNPGKNSISSIIGSYKSAVTRHCNRLGLNFKWQPRFHDHIIRNREEYIRIANYIIRNPQSWSEDKFYSVT